MTRREFGVASIGGGVALTGILGTVGCGATSVLNDLNAVVASVDTALQELAGTAVSTALAATIGAYLAEVTGFASAVSAIIGDATLSAAQKAADIATEIAKIATPLVPAPFNVILIAVVTSLNVFLAHFGVTVPPTGSVSPAVLAKAQARKVPNLFLTAGAKSEAQSIHTAAGQEAAKIALWLETHK